MWSIAPVLDLMFFCAHRPNAAAAPVLLISATIIPRMTRKMNMTAPSWTAEIMPSLMTLSIVSKGLNEVESKPPQTMPMKSDE